MMNIKKMVSALSLIYELNHSQMNHQNCKCIKCDNSLHYQIPTNIAFRIIGLKVYWCDKCDAETYIWPWTLNANEPIGQNNEI